MNRTRAIASLLALLLVGALAAEVILRAAAPDADGSGPPVRTRLELQFTANESTYVSDSELGARIAPLQFVRINTPEYSYTFRSDHAGFPNLEPWPGRIDVAVLGNSLITGAGVGYDGQFTTLLQKALGGKTVLNFGLPGGGTEHQLRIYRRFAAPLRPRLVIAMLWLTWEIDNSIQFNSWLGEHPRPEFTEYRFRYNDTHAGNLPSWHARARQLWSFAWKLFDRSYLLRTVHRRIDLLRGVPEPIERIELTNGKTLYLSAKDETRLMAGWQRPEMPNVREMFFRPLEELRAAVESEGGTFLVVLFPCKEELYASEALPEVLAPVREARIELQAHGIPTLDLYPVFQKDAASSPAFFSTDAHPNAAGHHMIADAIAQAVANKRVFDPAD